MESIELIKIQEQFEALRTFIKENCFKEVDTTPDICSKEIKELATDLAKAQAEFQIAGENRNNPYFKSAYADLMSVVSASRPALTKYGLSVMQIITDADDGKWLTTKMMHVSGQWVQSRVRIVPAKNDVQSISSTITYMKRVCYVSLVGVVVGGEDDDGEAAVATSRDTFTKGVALNTKYDARNTSMETISKDQLDEMLYELTDYPDIAEMVLEGLKLQNLADVPKEKYQVSMKRIREIKLARERK